MQRITHYKVKTSGTKFKVVAEVKQYGSIGPDPGTVIESTVILDNVSREYAELLAREYKKQEMESSMFGHAGTVGRIINMWVGANAEEWGERIKSPIVY